MKNIPDKELDEIFKQAAEHVDIQFNPTAWDKLEKKLDRSAVSKNGMGKIITVIGVLLISGALLWWNLTSGNETNPNTNAVDKYVLPNETKTGNITEEKTIKTTNDEKIKWLEDHRQIKAGAGVNFNVSQNAPVLNYSDIETVGEKVTAFQEVVLEDAPSDVPFASSVPPIWNLRMHDGNIEKVLPVIEPQEQVFKPYLSAGIRLSPDFSGTGMNVFSKTGTNIGVMVAYHFSKRFSIATGVTRSRKLYALREGFNPYDGYWDYKNKPDLIDGGCIVLDIPINLQYHILVGKRSEIFVSGGLSSYLMTKENYKYIYSNYESDYEIKNQNKHILSVLNLSVGYEHFLGRSWSVGVEPFAKLPLAQIGYGNLKLVSAGAYISFNYHFNKKTTLK